MVDVNIDIEFGVARAYVIDSVFVTGLIVAGPCRLVGWSVRETSGVAAFQAQLTSGSATIAEIGSASGLTDTKTAPMSGIRCPSGISVTGVSGAWTGCIYVAFP